MAKSGFGKVLLIGTAFGGFAALLSILREPKVTPRVQLQPKPAGTVPQPQPRVVNKVPAEVVPIAPPIPAPRGDAGATPGGVPGSDTEVPGYGTKGEQTFGPDDGVTPRALGSTITMDTVKALPGSKLPKEVPLTVEGFRWVDGAYRYVVSNPLSASLFGFDEPTIVANLKSGVFHA